MMRRYLKERAADMKQRKEHEREKANQTAGRQPQCNEDRRQTSTYEKTGRRAA